MAPFAAPPAGGYVAITAMSLLLPAAFLHCTAGKLDSSCCHNVIIIRSSSELPVRNDDDGDNDYSANGRFFRITLIALTFPIS